MYFACDKQPTTGDRWYEQSLHVLNFLYAHFTSFPSPSFIIRITILSFLIIVLVRTNTTSSDHQHIYHAHTHLTLQHPRHASDIEMAVTFTEREQKLMAMAWQCFAEQPKVDFEKLAGLVGMVCLDNNICSPIHSNTNRPTKDLHATPGHRSGRSLLSSQPKTETATSLQL
jgi:hypothetical protein